MGKVTKVTAALIFDGDRFMICRRPPYKARGGLWEFVGGKGFVSLAAWPEYDESMLAEDTVEIAVQVCGRLRATIELPRDCSKEDAARIISESGKIAAFTEGKTFVKDIYVPNRIYNIIIK